MRTTAVKLSKLFTINLGNYNNVKVGVDMTWELKEGEEFDFDAGWDVINREVSSQKDLDPAWIKNEETKDYYKTTVRVKK